MSFGCEVLFDAERASAMQEMVERATGGPCPCKQAMPCPLLPRDGLPVAWPVTQQARAS
jgi:hypothetical protein